MFFAFFKFNMPSQNSSSKLLSRLMLLRSILRILIALQLNATHPNLFQIY